MPRSLVLSNGNLFVAMDSDLSIRDLCWPYVGMLNHLSGHRVRLGVWCDGTFRWLSDPSWNRTLAYAPGTLATDVVAVNPALGLQLSVHDCVLHRADVLLRRFIFRHDSASAREVRLFFSHDFHIAETDIGDTAFYNPFEDAVVHYKRDCYLLLGAETENEGIFQYATGIKGFGGAEGTWRDAEDGALSMNAVAQGSVDSTLSVRLGLEPGQQQAEARAWICAGRTLAEVARLHERVRAVGFTSMLGETEHYWAAWAANERGRAASLPTPVDLLFRRSLLAVRSLIDNRGAIIAAVDSDIMQTARAHYAYMWPRDGALVAAALDRLGYQDITRRFFLFCRDVLPADRAALMHKYSADGSWGATWHPWIVPGGGAEIPFQEDSTALVLWALWRHYRRHGDLEFVEQVYDELAVPCAEFLAAYRQPDTGLPLPSYDIWEERRGVHAYTCGTVYAALQAAALMSDVFDDGRAPRYRQAAAELQAGMAEHLWDPDAGLFARCLVPEPDGGASYTRDLTIDAALSAVWEFGAFAPDDPRVEATMRRVVSRLWVKTEVGGLARYEGDYYFRQSDDTDKIPGNPWIICTLWAARWYVARARSRQELSTALELLMWVAQRALPTGMLPEQVHPATGQPLSVAPLTWSHAEFVATVLDYLDRWDSLEG